MILWLLCMMLLLLFVCCFLVRVCLFCWVFLGFFWYVCVHACVCFFLNNINNNFRTPDVEHLCARGA